MSTIPPFLYYYSLFKRELRHISFHIHLSIFSFSPAECSVYTYVNNNDTDMIHIHYTAILFTHYNFCISDALLPVFPSAYNHLSSLWLQIPFLSKALLLSVLHIIFKILFILTNN